MKRVGTISALIYTWTSILAASLFWLGTLAGKYMPVERLGGATWVFLLSMIILMPVVTQLVKRKVKAQAMSPEAARYDATV